MTAVLLLLAAAASAFAQAPAGEWFESRVRPVLARNCYSCHGPDKQSSGLRVDSRQALIAGGARGPAISPSHPENSLLLKAIRHEGPQMPLGGKLEPAEIAAIEQWIRTGAVWPAVRAASTATDWYDRAARTHWSFQPVRDPAPPAVRNAAWPRNEADRFVLAALEAKGLTPAPPAARRTLLRRAAFVLTGLPPSPADIDAFLADTASPDPFARAVDRLMDSPHFGEHWARHWMDVMRYGETRGYEWNYEIVGAWRYRDYLIRAFNGDVPYDQLVREHIAGDLLSAPRIDPREQLNESLIGTTFFRLGEAGHDDCVQFREISLDVVDNQIDTLGKAFQGLTLSCARCHDHKLDPIPTSDYYGLFGVLNSSRALTHTIDAYTVPPPAAARIDAIKRGIRAEAARLWREQAASLTLPASARLAFDHPLFPWLAMRTTATARFADVWAALAARYRQEAAARDAFNRANFTPFADFTGRADGWTVDGVGLRGGPSAPGDFAVAPDGGAALTALLPAGLHTNRHTDKWNGALRSPLLPKTKKYVSVRLMGGRLAARRTVLDNCAIGEGYRPIENASPAWVRLDTIAREKLPVFLEIITKSDNPRIPDRPGVLKASAAEIASPRSYFGAMKAVLHDTPDTPREELSHLERILARSPQNADELAAAYRDVTRAAVDAWAVGSATDDDVRWLDAMLGAGLLGNAKELSPRLAALVDEYRAVESGLPAPRVVDGLGDAGAGFDAPVLRSGNPQAPGQPAPRRFLSRVGPHTAPFQSPGSGRLELAGILASPDNPLTARVMVNRVWQHVFGRGIVATSDNFGREGERPSHPELLDHLASRFMREGWSVKKLVRLLVTSQTFRQSGEVAAAAREADPANALLHHYPLRRLEAEAVRDAMIAASGRLDHTLFGAGVPPPRLHPQDYRRLFNGPLDGAGRRSVYTQITRMEGPRFLEVFDYPNPMAARGTRDTTNVPAQALALMNDPFVLDQARTWGRRIAAGDGPAGAAEKVDAMIRAALARPATAAERERFLGLAAELASLRGVPRERMPADPGVWGDVAHAIFNLKEFLYIQ